VTLRAVCHFLCAAEGTVEDYWEPHSKWPPDVFAITSILLEETGAYRLIVSPPTGAVWPGTDGWAEQVREIASRWISAWETKTLQPEQVRSFREELETILSWPLDRFDTLELEHWEPVRKLLEIHAIADEACAGMGIPRASETFGHAAYHTQAHALLTENGTLATLPAHVVRVLPKLRTPQVGITLRSLSQHVTADRTGIGVTWRMINDVSDGGDPKYTERLNLLLLPWPEHVADSAFSPTDGPLGNLDRSRFGFFRFVPQIEAFEARFRAAVTAAKKQDFVHAVVLPEAALSDAEYDIALSVLKGEGVPLLVSGVRNDDSENFARLAECLTGPDEYYDQHKHHRWCVERNQIELYELEWVLHPNRRWWEFIKIRPRSLQFVIANEWLTICPLICEDLARIDPVGGLVRGVGPTLVIALLQDGPQLKSRWSARYATVLADDPGSSVLTLTSLGMSLRSVGGGYDPSRVVALWKDRTGAKELGLEEGASALLLSVCAEWQQEWSADGRPDGWTAAELLLAGVKQVVPEIA
jgi:hypothetical protein